MKHLLLFIIIVVSSVGCQARFGSANKDGNNGKTEQPPPPPDPKPDPNWAGGFSRLECHVQYKDEGYQVGDVGMLDAAGNNFAGQAYSETNFRCDDQLQVWAYFLDHDSTSNPVLKPSRVRVWYRVLVHPKWWNSDFIQEESGERELNYEIGNSFHLEWEFTKATLDCEIVASSQYKP